MDINKSLDRLLELHYRPSDVAVVTDVVSELRNAGSLVITLVVCLD